MKRLIASLGSLSLVLCLQLCAEVENIHDEFITDSSQYVEEDDDDAEEDQEQEDTEEQTPSAAEESPSVVDASPIQSSIEDAAEPEVPEKNSDETKEKPSDEAEESNQQSTEDNEQVEAENLKNESDVGNADPLQSPEIDTVSSDSVVAEELPTANDNQKEEDGAAVVEELTLEKDFTPLSQDREESTLASVAAAEMITSAPTPQIVISLSQVFRGSPAIYLTLGALSVVSLGLWLFNSLTLSSFKRQRESLLKNVKARLLSNHYEEAVQLCQIDDSPLSRIVISAIHSRHHGLQFMLESMKSEGKRATIPFWQRLNLIHDIAVIAPMIGLFGTVLGMLYAFYDLNRSLESVSALFDGLGVSVGTTVAGIFVAILAMILYSFSKYRLVQSLTYVENQAVAIAHLIDHK